MVKSPKENVNACEDFMETITSGLIVSSALETLQLKSIDDSPSDDVLPNAHDLWTKPETERRQCLKSVCNWVYDKFVR